MGLSQDPHSGATESHADRCLPTGDDLDTCWSTERQLWWRDFDEFGHVTAARYADLYQEAAGDFVVAAWRNEAASYVVARLDIRYLREIRREDSPVSVQVHVDRVGRSAFDLAMVVRARSGEVCSTAEGTYVGWDRRARASRAMDDAERAGLRDPLRVDHVWPGSRSQNT